MGHVLGRTCEGPVPWRRSSCVAVHGAVLSGTHCAAAAEMVEEVAERGATGGLRWERGRQGFDVTL
jgi:hypothetical protein